MKQSGRWQNTGSLETFSYSISNVITKMRDLFKRRTRCCKDSISLCWQKITFFQYRFRRMLYSTGFFIYRTSRKFNPLAILFISGLTAIPQTNQLNIPATKACKILSCNHENNCRQWQQNLGNLLCKSHRDQLCKKN